MKTMSRTSENVTTRVHIVLVAMCISLTLSFASSTAITFAGPSVGVDLVAAGLDSDTLHELYSEIETNQAGLLIDYGNGTISWVWVPFADDEITVMSMLEQSDLDLVTVGFGGLGHAVCQIEYTGCGPTECRQRMCQTQSSDPFWRVMRLHGDTWSMTSTGVDATRVGDGDIVALSWSATTPELPQVSMADVVANVNMDTGAPPDHAITLTIGDLPNAPEESFGWMPIAGSVGVVLVVAGGLIFRARRLQRVPV